MRITSKHIFSTLLLVLIITFHSLAQVGQYSYILDKSKSLDQVFDDLSKRFDLEFSYPSKLIKTHTVNKSNFKSPSLSGLLNDILINTRLEFQIIENRKILLRPKRNTTNNKPENKSNNSLKISGTIHDENGNPLGYVDVILDTLFIGGSSDENGYFEFDIPSDLIDRSISFHLVGFSSINKSIKQNQIQPATNLNSSIMDIKEVILVEKVKSVELDSISLGTKSQANYLNNIISAPVISSDINRSLQMSAGIDATNDLDASIRIRGSQDDETLIVLDGIPIYKAEHFYGIFGSINGNHINTVSLYKNNLPLEFGGKTGGLVEMNSKDYFNKVTAGIDLNMLTSSITLSGPINKKWSFIASGRTTYDNAADSKLFDWIEPSPEEAVINGAIAERPLVLNTSPIITFFDVNGKLIFRPNERHLFSWSVFNSQDNFNNAYDIAFSNPLVFGTIQGQEKLNDHEDWQNFGVSLQHTGSFKNSWKINSRIYNSSFDYSGSLNTSLRLERNNNEFFTSLTNQKQNQIKDWGFHSILSKKTSKGDFSIGLSGIQHDVLFNFQADDSRKIDVNTTGFEGALFSGYRWSLSDDWMVNIGGRMDYYSETEQVYFAPRVSSNYKLSDYFSLKGAFAKHYQFLREVTLYTRLREPIDIFLLTSDGKSDRTYPVGSSINSMIGLTYHNDHWTLDMELYNKDMDGVINHTETILGLQDPDDNKPLSRINSAVIGTGRSYGIDVSLGYQQKDYTAWLAYTLSKTTNQFEEIFQNAKIPSENDRRHQLKFNNQLTLGNWSLNGSYVFASGLNQLNLFDTEEGINLNEIFKDQAFSRLDPYHRLDLGVTYEFDLLSKKVSLGLGVFNLTNNKNADYTQYLFAVPTRKDNVNRNALTGTTTQLLDRTFNLTFKAEF